MTVLESWAKAIGDLPHTRTAVTFGIIGTVIAVAAKTASLIRSIPDGVMLLQALFPYAGIILAYHFGQKAVQVGKELLTKRNGGNNASGQSDR